MQGFMIMLLICSVTMSVLGLLYMAVTPLLTKRYSVKSLYYAWLVLVVGLIIPYRPQFSHPIVKLDMPVDAAMPVVHAAGGAPAAANAPNVLASAAPQMAQVTWWQIGLVVWLAGMVLFLAYHIIRHHRFLKLTAHWSEAVTDGPMLILLQKLKTQMGISQTIGLQVCGCIGSPMMIGFTRPRILLPKADFAQDELRFILKHELVHYKRRDLWYKGLALAATAIHWFNPIVHLMAKEIDRQCELSCDAEVVRSTDADTRLSYSETIIGVVRYKSKLQTALSTNFYGGKKGMKSRIFSIMDMSKKKVGAAVLCAALLLTMGTGAAFAASAASTETSKPPTGTKEPTWVKPWIPVVMFPNPENYSPYEAFGITISEDGTQLLYNGQPVRVFADDESETAFYLDSAGDLNLAAVRNADGEITGIESISAEKAQKYCEDFYAEELDPGFFEQVRREAEQDLAEDMVKEGVTEGDNKYEAYQPYGLTCSESNDVLTFNGQRVKFFIDQSANGDIAAMWEDDAGTVNVAAVRDASGQLTGVESISEEKAQEYKTAVDESMVGLDERVEAKVNAMFPELDERVEAHVNALFAEGKLHPIP